MFKTTQIALAFFLVLTLIVPAVALDLVDFLGQTPGASNWQVTCKACGGDIQIDFTTTITGEYDKWARETLLFTEPSFANTYGSEANVMSLLKLEPTDPNEMTMVRFLFPNAMPAGSQLIAFDVDGAGEQLEIVADTAPLTPPTLMETVAGANSAFADWVEPSQTLLSVDPNFDNQKEAYIFDIAGVQEITVTFKTDEPAVNNLSIAVPAVPEPATQSLLALSFIGMGILRLRQR